MKHRLDLRDIEFCLLGMGAGIFIGFALAERGHTFTANWGWAIGSGIMLAGFVVGAIHSRRLKNLSNEKHLAR